MPSISSLKKYEQVGKNLGKACPVLPYYCNLMVVQKGISQPDKSPEDEQKLSQLMTYLEENKALSASMTPAQAQQAIQTLAYKFFAAADQDSQAGRSWKGSLKKFYMSKLMMDVLVHMGDTSEETSSKCAYAWQMYSKIKTTLAQGSQPAPCAYGQSVQSNMSTPSAAYDFTNAQPTDQLPTHNNMNTANIPSTVPAYDQNPQYRQPQQPRPAQSWRGPPTGGQAAMRTEDPPQTGEVLTIRGDAKLATDKLDAILKGEKLIKSALNAVRFEDLPTVCREIQQAMAIMHPWKDAAMQD